MKQKYFYKVVRKGNLKSCRMDRYPELCTKYKLNKWVYPKLKKTKLMVFDLLKNAKLFANGCRSFNCNDVIYKCEVKNVENCKTIISFGWLEDEISAVKSFWKTKKLPINLKNNWTISESPSGTYQCDAVKLIEEIKEK